MFEITEYSGGKKKKSILYTWQYVFFNIEMF